MQRTIGFVAMAACFVLAGGLLDGSYQRSTPGSLQAQGTIVDFERRHSRQVYPVFEFKDADGILHRVVNSTQQTIVRFSRGDSVPIAYSNIDPERARIDTLWFNHRWVIGGIIVGLAIVIRTLAGAGLKKN
jgi:translation initiation factor IF-1